MIVMPFFFMTLVIFAVVGILAFQLSARLDNGTLGCIGNHKKIKRLRQNQQRSIDRCDVYIAFGGVFKPDDIRTRGVQFHRDLRSVKCDIKLANAVFVTVQLPRFLGKNWR
jgi:hypothetical protein